MKILILILFPVLIFAETYYVDNFAPASGDGSINSPFNSITSAIDVSQPGDSIYLRGSHSEYGQIYFEDLDLARSGNSDKWISIQNYADEVVVISIRNDFKIDANYWNFSGIIFENLNSGFTASNISSDNIHFSDCVFRTKNTDSFK